MPAGQAIGVGLEPQVPGGAPAHLPPATPGVGDLLLEYAKMALRENSDAKRHAITQEVMAASARSLEQPPRAADPYRNRLGTGVLPQIARCATMARCFDICACRAESIVGCPIGTVAFPKL